MKVKFSRWLMVIVAIMLLLTACTTPKTATEEVVADAPVEDVATEAPAAEATEAPSTDTESSAAASECQFSESPMLAEKVASGELPSVCERLPVEPLVFTQALIIPEGYATFTVGEYGGPLVSTIGEGAILLEPLFYSINRTPITTGSMVFSSFEPNDDYTEFVFNIREGLKWSDGVPVTTEDLEFSFNDVLLNTDLYPTFPNWLRTGGTGSGNPATFAKVDDFVFTLTFDGPYTGFSKYLAGNWMWTSNIFKPKHYLSQFHEKYADATELAAAVEAAAFDEWYELFRIKDVIGNSEEASIGMPRLDPWILVEYAEDHYTHERNPYYGAVDSAGNQIPYIDTYITYPVSFTAPETAELMMFTGEGHYNWNLDLTKLPLYKSEEANGKFWSIPYPNKDSRQFSLNLTFADDTWRSVVQDVRFRRALGLAMDCARINQEIYLDTATIPTITHDCVYDPAAAEALLDEMGMTELDADGFRMTPDGQPFELPMTLMSFDIGYNSQAPFLEEMFEAVGIKTSYKMVESTIYWEMMNANEMQATIIWSFSPKFESNTQYPEFLPTTKNAPLWWEWYMNAGTMGEEPPDYIKEAFAIFEAMGQEVYGSAAYKALEAQRDAWVKENVPYLDFVEQPGIVHMFSTCLGNPATGPLYHHGSWTQHRLVYLKSDCGGQ